MLSLLCNSSNPMFGTTNGGFYFFGIEIAWYGVIVTTGIVMAFLLYLFLAKKRNIDLDFSMELFIWVVVLAVLCCRLFYVIPREEFWPSSFTWEDFKHLWAIKQGGLTIIGGIFGGALGILLCCLRNRRYHFIQIGDLVVVALLLGQIIGRWGNFVNGELYGQEITNPAWQWFPIAVQIGSRYYMALFFYEGVLNAIGLAIALTLFFKLGDKLKNGTLGMFYLAWYGLVRGTIEFFKIEHETIGNTDIGIVQVICYTMCIVAIVLLGLVQTGKIRLQTKWFARQIELKEFELKCDAQLAELARQDDLRKQQEFEQSVPQKQYEDTAQKDA